MAVVELVDHIHPALVTLRYDRPLVKAAVGGAAFLFFLALYVLLHGVFMVLSSTYRSLRLKHKVFWNLAAVRGVYGCISTVVALWAVLCDTGLEEDVVLATTPTSHLAMCSSAGFFVFECLAVLLSDLWFGTFSRMLHVHHWLSLAGFSLVVYTDTAHFIGCKGLILEMSTPFSGLCWTLLKCGLEKSALWKANQLVLVHTFHLRNVIELYLWWVTWTHRQHVWAAMPAALMAVLYTNLALITLFMTPYWTFKKTQQFFFPADWNFDAKDKDKGDLKKGV